MTAEQCFRERLAACPLVAILRGVMPAEVEGIGEALVSAGIGIIEVPLNSPEPLRSIELLARRLGDGVLVGAGTVLDPADVPRIQQVGGRVIVSPSTDVAVIEATLRERLVSLPGYFTPSEAFLAINAGANALKLFPAEAASPAVLKAQRAVMPRATPILVVGGITTELVAPYLAAGADGFGLGSALYKPGMSAEVVAEQARSFVNAVSGAQLS
jgi:2-dehydro-3-deoxyphosphogalactonate aldolase